MKAVVNTNIKGLKRLNTKELSLIKGGGNDRVVRKKPGRTNY